RNGGSVAVAATGGRAESRYRAHPSLREKRGEVSARNAAKARHGRRGAARSAERVRWCALRMPRGFLVCETGPRIRRARCSVTRQRRGLAEEGGRPFCRSLTLVAPNRLQFGLGVPS